MSDDFLAGILLGALIHFALDRLAQLIPER